MWTLLLLSSLQWICNLNFDFHENCLPEWVYLASIFVRFHTLATNPPRGVRYIDKTYRKANISIILKNIDIDIAKNILKNIDINIVRKVLENIDITKKNQKISMSISLRQILVIPIALSIFWKISTSISIYAHMYINPNANL